MASRNHKILLLIIVRKEECSTIKKVSCAVIWFLMVFAIMTNEKSTKQSVLRFFKIAQNCFLSYND